MAIHFQILIGSRRMRMPLIRARDLEAFIGQGEQAQGRSWRLTKEAILCVCGGGEEKKRRRKKRRGEIFLVLTCARIKHGKSVCVCSKYL